MQFHTVPAGEKISEPGGYDIPIERYHTQCCVGDSLSSSDFRRLIVSPANFWMLSNMNPDRIEEPEKEAFALGRAAHHLLLGEDDFGKLFAIRPTTAPDGRPWNGNNKSCQEWLAQKALDRITVLTESQVETIRGMAGLLPWQKGMTNCGLANTPIIAEGGLLNGLIEKSMFWKDRDTGIWLKARPDAIPLNTRDYGDLKTASGVDQRSLEFTLHDRGYFIQGALIGMGAREALGSDMDGFTLVFVDKKPPYAVSVRSLTVEDLALGEMLIHVALKLFVRCRATGIWPGPTAHEADAEMLRLPPWSRERFEKHIEMLEAQF